MTTANTPENFWSRALDVRGPDDCWECRGRREDGYGRTRWQGRQRPTHRVAWELHNGRRLEKHEVVLHRCDNPPCCNPAHLEAGSAADNHRDMVRKGRGAQVFKRGAGNPSAKVTPEQVRLARRLRAEGLKLREISERIGLKESAVWSICQGLTWRSITEEAA